MLSVCTRSTGISSLCESPRTSPRKGQRRTLMIHEMIHPPDKWFQRYFGVISDLSMCSVGADVPKMRAQLADQYPSPSSFFGNEVKLICNHHHRMNQHTRCFDGKPWQKAGGVISGGRSTTSCCGRKMRRIGGPIFDLM